VNGAPSIDIKFKALFALIEHPLKGWMLFDTGYTDRFYKATKRFPNKIYALITKVFITKNDELKTQLISIGIEPKDIKHIIISHFHADHIGGLRDFENATIYCSKDAYRQVKSISSFFAFSKGIIKSLLPEDIETRLKFIEEISTPNDDEIFGMTYDLFNDDTIEVYELPGHAAGQIGVRLQTEKAQYFLIADACWDERAYQQLALPHPIVKLFFDSWTAYKNTIYKLRAFHQKYPEVKIMPTHCETSTSKFINTEFDIDAL
jgi:glyoxylase-like metal-dependent hydrolase (beta-lactamase superfamily II)